MKKRCRRCGELKEESEFHKNKTKKDGLQSECKDCRKEYYSQKNEQIANQSRECRQRNKEQVARRNHIWYMNNKEREAKRHREYQKQNKERIAKRNQEYRKQHKERVAKSDREYYKRNKDSISKRGHKYRERNKERIAKRMRGYLQTANGKLASKRANHNRRALMDNIGATLTVDQWNTILKQQANRCLKCKKRFTKKNPPTADHIIPLSKGGGLTFENCQALCVSCNCKKGNKLHRGFILTWCVNL